MAAAKVVEQRKAPNPKQEIYTYQAPWIVYGLAWSNNNAEPYRLAIGSFTEEYSNKVQVRRRAKTQQGTGLKSSS